MSAPPASCFRDHSREYPMPRAFSPRLGWQLMIPALGCVRCMTDTCVVCLVSPFTGIRFRISYDLKQLWIRIHRRLFL